MEQYGECGYTSLDNCESGSLQDSNISIVNEYCCGYVLGTSSNLSQQDLFEVITIVRNLNIASLVSDYFFVILAISVFIYVIRTKSDNDKFSKVAIPVLILSVLGSFIDICITFAIVGVIDQNELISTLFGLYAFECYSNDITLTLLDLKGQFETILILDSVEGVLDIVSLCVLFGGHLWHNEIFRSMSAGIHGFMFAVFDLALITVNVFVFVLPSYTTFVQSYNNNNYLCFEKIPTMSPTIEPTFQPTTIPTFSPTLATDMPSKSPTDSRLYSISMTVSNTSYHGVHDLFFRLCSDNMNTCTNWYAVIDVIDVVSDTYSLNWTTWDIDNIYFVDIATIGAEPWCLEQITVDSITSSPPNNTICILTNTPNGCSEMHINLQNNTFSTESSDPCVFDEIVNHPALNTSNVYLTTFDVSNYIGREYEVGPENKWVDANQYCQDTYGTTLATITSREDRDKAQAALQEANAAWAWIGLNDLQSQGTWEWVDGTDCSYTGGNCKNDPFWNPGEPTGDHERCTYISTANGVYNDNSCDNTPYTLCNYYQTP